LQAISGTMGLMDSAGKVMKGLAAAGEVVVGEAVRAAEDAGSVLSGDEGKQVSSPSDSEGKERGPSS
jgi:hypothetical protein